MNLSIIFFVIVTVLATGNCTICYSCVDGEKTNELQHYKSCNRFLENHTCNTTWVSSSCVTIVSDYLHKRTVLYDCMREERPIKHGTFEVETCSRDYCNRNQDRNHYSRSSSEKLHFSLGIILMIPIYFLSFSLCQQ